MNKPDLVHLSAERLHIRVERVFGLAYDYAESRHRKSFIVEKYHQWRSTGKLPDEVFDFALDVMIGRVNKEEVQK